MLRGAFFLKAMIGERLSPIKTTKTCSLIPIRCRMSFKAGVAAQSRVSDYGQFNMPSVPTACGFLKKIPEDGSFGYILLTVTPNIEHLLTSQVG